MSFKIDNLETYRKLHAMSMEDPNNYWNEVARSFEWFKKWDNTQLGSFETHDVKWFEGGQTNITLNALDRHAKTTPRKTAIIWDSNDPLEEEIYLSYEELLKKVNQFANLLKSKNVKKGDRVCLYMGMVPELLISTLACARIGAIHSVIFGGFSAKALSERINDCSTKVLITQDEAHRGDKTVPLKKIADEALESSPGVETVLTLERTKGSVKMKIGRDFWIHDLIDLMSDECSPEVMDSEDPLFILYTSGSTGQPKGLVHTTAGYMIWAAETYKHVFQTKEDDIFWCTADIGWITGHSYLTYGPLLNGSTQVMFEGIPTYPDASRFWNVVDKFKITHFYTAPTAIRSLQACEQSFVDNADLSSLKVLGSVGEPINIEAWNWYNEKVGKNKCPIVDTWWQTETGGIMISNLAGVTPSIACYATLPLPGVHPVLVDADGKKIDHSPASGNLCIDKPWPGMARTIYGDHERYKKTYFSTYPGKYFTGDGALCDNNGNFRITGRVDDVINVSGHRIGTAEVENAINEHELIVESAVVGFPHPIKGEALMAFAITNSIEKDLILKEVNALLTKSIGPIAKLDTIILVSGLPKTRSGKIMRRILRKVAAGEIQSLGDTSTLLNPEIVQEIIEKCS